MLLLAGGDNDPQMIRLLRHAMAQGIPVYALLTGQSGVPRLRWDIKAKALLDGGRELNPSAAFIRQDVFTYLQSNQAQDQWSGREWYNTLAGWLLSRPDIKVFNRHFLGRGPVNKPYILHLALSLGLRVADTLITNDGILMGELAPSEAWVRKPVGGGAHCELLAQAPEWTGSLAYPQIVQRRLQQPEMRVFKIADQWLGFWVISDVLDYRSSTSTRLELAEVPEKIRQPLNQLTEVLGLDFAAADFKTDPETGELYFLEINTNPMFAGFDQIANGALCAALFTGLRT